MTSFVHNISATCNVAEVQQLKSLKLPDAIIANGQWIVADMDGTLIGAPGYRTEPTLAESPAKESIFAWLRAGGNLLVLTGCETDRTIERFAAFIPDDLKSALTERRLLLCTNGGSTLSYFDGTTWREDVNFRKSAIPQKEVVIPQQAATHIVDNAVALVNRFYKEMAENPQYLDQKMGTKLAEKLSNLPRIARENPNGFSPEKLVTLDSNTVPRIEVRKAEKGAVVQIAIIGIPVDLKYDLSSLQLDQIADLHMEKVNLTHEINVKGVDKALVIGWLQSQKRDGYPLFEKEKSVAIGDRPGHNDAPLTKACAAFVSVCERDQPDYIPAHVTLRIGHNQEGTAKLLSSLLSKANDFAKSGKQEAVIPATIQDVVHEVRT